jgi:glucose/arabinose dehydrogenase
MRTQKRLVDRLVCFATALLLTGCGGAARLQVSEGMGPNPVLPAPRKSLIPVIQVARARGWPEGATPTPAEGLQVSAFASGLEHPRWLYVLPNGDVLVAETNAPPRPQAGGGGLRGWAMNRFMKAAGAAVPSANRITLLRDTDRDGVADQRSVFLENLNSPFGMALVGNELFVANSDGVDRFSYAAGETRIDGPATRVAGLPAGPINYHWTKNLIVSPDGSRLYVAVGSNSNVGERGLENEEGRAAIWEIDRRTGAQRVFASGLRNPVGMAWEPETGVLWTSVNERDELGSDLVPDYITSVHDGAFYGWPYSYYGQNVDDRVKAQRTELVAAALVPDYALGPHTGSLGLVFSPAASTLPAGFRNGMIVGQHGSWNRQPFSGYRVIFIPFERGRPAGDAVEILTGFLNARGEANGRPVGVTMDASGALLVADDVGNVIWRVTGRPAN